MLGCHGQWPARRQLSGSLADNATTNLRHSPASDFESPDRSLNPIDPPIRLQQRGLLGPSGVFGGVYPLHYGCPLEGWTEP